MSRLRTWINRRKRQQFRAHMERMRRERYKAAEEPDMPDLDLDMDDDDDDEDEGFPPFEFRPSWMDRTIPSSPFFHPESTAFFRPLPNVRMDWYEDATECVLEVELPGVKREDIHLRVEETVLVIEADLPVRRQHYRRNYLATERQTGHLSHPVTLHNIRREGIRASLADGVLTITMPRNDPDPTPESYEIQIG